MAEHAHEDAHDHDHEHDHGALAFTRTEVSDDTLARLREQHADLAANLELTRRFADLSDEEKEQAILTQRKVEGHAAWTPGFHAPGDTCGACGKATIPLFTDTLEQGAIPYGAFVAGVPVHPEPACIAAFAKAHPNPSPRDVDRLRRAHMKDLARPSPTVAMFLRHDLIAQPPFGIEDWANSVAEANPDMGRATTRDIERLMQWVHRKLFH